MDYPLSFALKTIISNRSTLAIIKQLVLNYPNPITLREISRQEKLNINAVSRAFHKLTKSGIVKYTKAGAKYNATLNQPHPFFPSLVSIIHQSTGLGYLLHKRFAKDSSISYIILTPYYIKNPIDQQAEQNLDDPTSSEDPKPFVILIGEPNLVQLTQTFEELEHTLGITIPLSVLSITDVATRIRVQDPFVWGVISDVHVFIKGNLMELLSHGGAS